MGKAWRKQHPYGFFARASKNPDGSTNLLVWKCGIPGKKGGHWEGAVYRLKMIFSDDYPIKPPQCQFQPTIFHPNIYPSGDVCLSILDPKKAWKPGITVTQILVHIQELLESPNNDDPAQRAPHELFKKDKEAYWKRVRHEAQKYSKAK